MILSISRYDKKDYLGLIVEEELEWNKHIDLMCKKTIICNFWDKTSTISTRKSSQNSVYQFSGITFEILLHSMGKLL